MERDSDDRDEAREQERALVGELRAIIEALSRVELSGTDAARALELARELRERIRGPERERWHSGGTPEAGGGFGRASRVAYMNQSPVRGELNPVAPPLRVEVVSPGGDEADYVEGRCTLGSAYEGLAGAVHGGWVAALFDDVLSAAQGTIGAWGVTAVLKTRFREVTPLYEELRLRAWIAERRGRRIIVRGTCHAGQTLTADAEGIFMEVDFEQVRERMEALQRDRQ